jgi:hypothetical protein
MSTQVTAGRRRSQIGATLVALALAVAVFVLATQASSIWSTKAGSQVQPVPVHVVAPGERLGPWSFSHRPHGCRPKIGCGLGLRKSSQIPNGCRVKYGCEDGHITTRGGHSFARSKKKSG